MNISGSLVSNKNPLSSPCTGRRDFGGDLCCARQCREEGVVKVGLLPEPQAPATQRPLPPQSGTVRCVRGYSVAMAPPCCTT